MFVKFDPNGILSGFTTMPIQIFDWAAGPQEEFQQLAAAASILLLVLVIAMNGVAIFIRNKLPDAPMTEPTSTPPPPPSTAPRRGPGHPRHPTTTRQESPP